MSNRVGVVIPARNRHEYIPLCIASIQAQTVKPHRVILVDDGSNPPISDSFSWENVEIVRTGVGNGSSGAAARSFGAKLLNDCDFILPIDADDFIEPRYIEKLLAGLQSDPRAAIAYPELHSFGDLKGILKVTISAGGLIHNDILRQVGYFPITTAWDEQALAQRIDMLGFTKVFTDAVYYYRRHDDSISGEFRHVMRPYIETVDLNADFVSIVHIYEDKDLADKDKLPPIFNMKFIAEKDSFSDHHERASYLNRVFARCTSDYLIICDIDQPLKQDMITRLLQDLSPSIDALCLGDMSDPWQWLTVDDPSITPATNSEEKVGGFKFKCCILAKDVYKRYRVRSNVEPLEVSFFKKLYTDGRTIEARWPACQRSEEKPLLPNQQRIVMGNMNWRAHKEKVS